MLRRLVILRPLGSRIGSAAFAPRSASSLAHLSRSGRVILQKRLFVEQAAANGDEEGRPARASQAAEATAPSRDVGDDSSANNKDKKNDSGLQFKLTGPEDQRPSAVRAKTEEGLEYTGGLDKEGRPDGTGRLVDPQKGASYMGQWRAGHMHGWGKLIQDGIVFEGQWDNGVLTSGTVKKPGGPIYTGSLRENRPYGPGRYTLPDGTVFDGYWAIESDLEDTPEDPSHQPEPVAAQDSDLSNQLIGKGTIRFSDSIFYEGEWRDLKPHGYGMLRFADGSEYEGQFERGLYHGLGTIRYANKIEYQGQWSKGRRQGRGRICYADGTTEVGHWTDDELVASEQSQEVYDHTIKSFIYPEKQIQKNQEPTVNGPSEPRGRWPGRTTKPKQAGAANIFPTQLSNRSKPIPRWKPH